MADTRYPYTYAADFIRAIPECGSNGVILSRSDAARITERIAEVLGIPKVELCNKLADAELAKTEADRELQARKIIASLDLGEAI
jgi:hypothetical protein